MHTSIKYLIRVLSFVQNAHFYKVFDKGTVFCSGFVIQCQGCTCAGWLWEGEGGLGDHQPGVYVPLKALFLVGICSRSQVSVYRTIGPLVLIFAPKHRLWVLFRTASARRL